MKKFFVHITYEFHKGATVNYFDIVLASGKRTAAKHALAELERTLPGYSELVAKNAIRISTIETLTPAKLAAVKAGIEALATVDNTPSKMRIAYRLNQILVVAWQEKF